MRRRSVRTAEISFESTELFLSRQAERGHRGWCAACRQNVYLLPAEEAARAAGVSLRTMFRWIEAGRVHLVESGRSSLICLSSIIAVSESDVKETGPPAPTGRPP